MKTRKHRTAQGKFRQSWKTRLTPILFLIATIISGLFIQGYFSKQEMLNPCDNNGCTFNFVVRAYEPEVEEVQEPQTITEIIHEVFKEDGEFMVKIFTCESGLNPENIGDKHLMGWLNGEYLGDSVGIAQIRTGNAPGTYDKSAWNRAKANGMTVEQFRAKLKEPRYNIEYAKTIFDRQGITAWYNCYQKVK